MGKTHQLHRMLAWVSPVIPFIVVCMMIHCYALNSTCMFFWFTLLLFRVLDILLLRKLKVRITLYFSDSAFAGMVYLSNSSSSILKMK